mmetsp:Transcript_16215/g.33824  ORF Transcript_16215/g.33824 Transcript_16215/m.33824 type:complete len:94 (-) Transcript_16215:69-350(-)
MYSSLQWHQLALNQQCHTAVVMLFCFLSFAALLSCLGRAHSYGKPGGTHPGGVWVLRVRRGAPEVLRTKVLRVQCVLEAPRWFGGAPQPLWRR